MTTILIVEDEERIVSFLERGLNTKGFATVVAGTGDEALAAARAGGIDLMLLDLGLPDKDGLEVLSELREEGHTLPVIVLTARDDVPSTVAGLIGGADEYITKPFSVEDLVSRISKRLRSAEGKGLLRGGGLVLDLHGAEAVIGEKRVHLTRSEAELLSIFLEQPDETLTREQVLSLWTAPAATGDVVETYVGHLCAKLGETMIGIDGGGYRLGEATI